MYARSYIYIYITVSTQLDHGNTSKEKLIRANPMAFDQISISRIRSWLIGLTSASCVSSICLKIVRSSTVQNMFCRHELTLSLTDVWKLLYLYVIGTYLQIRTKIPEDNLVQRPNHFTINVTELKYHCPSKLMFCNMWHIEWYLYTMFANAFWWYIIIIYHAFKWQCICTSLQVIGLLSASIRKLPMLNPKTLTRVNRNFGEGKV